MDVVRVVGPPASDLGIKAQAAQSGDARSNQLGPWGFVKKIGALFVGVLMRRALVFGLFISASDFSKLPCLRLFSRLQKVGIQVWGDFCWCSLLCFAFWIRGRSCYNLLACTVV